jgi:hypothetical protein
MEGQATAPNKRATTTPAQAGVQLGSSRIGVHHFTTQTANARLAILDRVDPAMILLL